MAEQAVTTDVKPQAPETSTEVQPEVQANTPGSEQLPAQTTATETAENRVPLTRLNEVIEQRNELKTRYEELERRLQAVEKPQETQENKYIKTLVERGMDEDAAKLLVETASMIAEEKAESFVQPVLQKSAKREVDEWRTTFAKAHPDFIQLEPKMLETFKGLSKEMREYVVSSDKELENFYYMVKGREADASAAKAAQLAADEAYKTKGLKTAVSSTPGATATNTTQATFTREQIAQMDSATYLKNRARIMELMNEGKL